VTNSEHILNFDFTGTLIINIFDSLKSFKPGPLIVDCFGGLTE